MNKDVIIAIIVTILLAIVAGLVLKQCEKAEEFERKEQKHKQLSDAYFEIKVVYENKISELENIIANSNDNTDINKFKQQLVNTLSNIKTDLSNIEQQEIENIDDYSKTKYSKLLAYNQTHRSVDSNLVLSLNTRIKELENKFSNVSITLSDVQSELNLYKNLYEVEKRKNLDLSSQIASLNEQLQNKRYTSTLEREELTKKLAQFEEKQKESERNMQKERKEMRELAEKLNRVRVDCFFVYKPGNSRKELKVYLTNDGLSKIYYNYFTNKKPNVVVSFDINSELFQDDLKKLTLKVYDADNRVVFKNEIPTSSSSNNGDIEITVRNSSLSLDGQYTVELKHGTRDIITGASGKYKFQIIEK